MHGNILAPHENMRQAEATLKLIAPRSGGRVHRERLIFSCLMDNKPKYIHQTFVLLWTLLDLARVPAERIVVQAVEGCDDLVLSALRTLGVRLRTVRPFAEGFPNCNKLRQLGCSHLLEADVAVLLDTDTAVLQDVSPAASKDSIRAKIVAGPNPSIEVLRNIFLKAGFDDVPLIAETSFGLGLTLRLNVNGGVYFLPRVALKALSAEWPKRAHWLIDNKELLCGAHFALDQVSFALACHALGLDIDLLPTEMNYQIQFNWPAPIARFPPFILHYHNNTDSSGMIALTGEPRVDAAIRKVNGVIRRRMPESMKDAFSLTTR